MAKILKSIGDEVLTELPPKSATVAKPTETGDRQAVTTPGSAYSTRAVRGDNSTGEDGAGVTLTDNNTVVDQGDRTTTAAQPSATETPAPSVAGYDPERDGSAYNYLLRTRLKGYVPQTEEERREQRKRSARDQLIGSIGDAVSALSNMYFTTQGAPSDKVSGTSLSDAARKRYERLKKERDDDEAAYLATALKLATSEAAEAKQALESKYKEHLIKTQTKREERLAQQQKEKADERKREQDRKERESNARIKTEESKQRVNEAKIANGGRLPSSGRVRGTKRSGGKKGKKPGSKKRSGGGGGGRPSSPYKKS